MFNDIQCFLSETVQVAALLFNPQNGDILMCLFKSVPYNMRVASALQVIALTVDQTKDSFDSFYLFHNWKMTKVYIGFQSGSKTAQGA